MGEKRVTVTITLFFRVNELITSVKKFMIQAQDRKINIILLDIFRIITPYFHLLLQILSLVYTFD
jgi:hypothetical protein